MAQKILLVDDFDKETPARRVQFSVAGDVYEIDLSEENLRELRETLAPWIEAGRRVTRSRSKRGPSRSSARTSRSAEIRAWARAEGISVNGSGRIPDSVVAQFDAAHAGSGKRPGRAAKGK